MKMMDAKFIDILKACDSPTVCNAIELFKVRPQNEGFLHHSIQALFPELPPMVGYAVTCTFTSAKPGKGHLEYDSIGKQVESLLAVPAPRVVVFQDLDPDPVGASFGEMLASTYMKFGCTGIITSGGARDTEAIRKKKLPLFARSRNLSHSYPQILAMNVPVKVGGVTIKPGDLLHGDADGVTTVPNELAPQIALMCREFLRAEKGWLNYLEMPNATAAGVNAAVSAMKEAVAQAMKQMREKEA